MLSPFLYPSEGKNGSMRMERAADLIDSCRRGFSVLSMTFELQTRADSGVK